MRLQKYLADAGIASRRRCEELIRKGLVRVNGNPASIGMEVEPGRDTVFFDGEPVIKDNDRVIIAFYKPKGVICANYDPKSRRTTADYFQQLKTRLYHVGRLDYDSEGLLLMTNDGDFALRMTHPRYGVMKTYYTECDGRLTNVQRLALENGVSLEDGPTAPARIQDVNFKNGKTSFYITISEGRNRQIRRMLESVGHKTLKLCRVRQGDIELRDLKPGEWRYLTEREINELYR